MTVSASDLASLQEVVPKPVYSTGAPRYVAVIDGQPYVCVRWKSSANAHGATNTCTVELTVEHNPDFSIQLFRGKLQGSTDAIYTPVYCELRAGFSENPDASSTEFESLKRRFLGIVDAWSAEFHNDRVIFTCRSLAAPLLDDQIQRLLVTAKTTDFVTACAQYAGLKVDTLVGPGKTASQTTVQEVLGADLIGGAAFNGTVYRMHPWDLILRCAEFDDVDAWVQDDTLYYKAPSLIDRNRVDMPWFSVWETLTASHAILFSKKIRVVVRTAQPRHGHATVVSITNDGNGGIDIKTHTKDTTSATVFGTSQSVTTTVSSTGTTTISQRTATGGTFTATGMQGLGESRIERYTKWIKNASPSQAIALAKSIWRQISMMEYTIEGDIQMTPELLSQLSITSLLNVSNSPYLNVNSTYWPRMMEESGSPEEGWRMHILAVNHTLPQGAV